MCVVLQRLRFREEGQGFLDHRVPIGHGAQPLQLTELAGDDVLPDADLQPIGNAVDVVVGPVDVLRSEELFEVG